jgi:hypothetical protein
MTDRDGLDVVVGKSISPFSDCRWSITDRGGLDGIACKSISPFSHCG